MEKICSAAFQPAFSEGKVVESGKGKALANAQEFSDFIKLMSMSGRNGYSHCQRSLKVYQQGTK